MSKKKTTLLTGLLLLALGFLCAIITANVYWHFSTMLGGFVYGWGLAIRE